MAEAACEIPGAGAASDYAVELLASLDCRTVRVGGPPDPPASHAWAASGAMALTGRADGPPRAEPAGVALVAQGAERALRSLAACLGVALEFDGPALLAERAGLLGLARRGRISAGGASRLLETADGWVAVTLARPDDFASLPAWLGERPSDEPWRFVADRLRTRPLADAVTSGRLLGLAVAAAVDRKDTAPPWMRVAARGRPARGRGSPPLVVDLSSLWAGPLCTRLLQLAGARVVKVESASRPDGARAHPRFFERMNAGKELRTLDFTSEAGRALRDLVGRADVVVESARPRALAQLGIDAEALVAERPGLVWVAISGHGRREPGAGWVAFGDDAAAAAGLAALAGRGGDGPLFCGDAIADPLAGLHAAVAALACLVAGRGALLDLSLCDVAAQALRFEAAAAGARVLACERGFCVVEEGERQAVLSPDEAMRPSAACR
jgi:hypothetical protein